MGDLGIITESTYPICIYPISVQIFCVAWVHLFSPRCGALEVGATAQRRHNATEAGLPDRRGPEAAVPQEDWGGGLGPGLHSLQQPLHSQGGTGPPAVQVK